MIQCAETNLAPMPSWHNRPARRGYVLLTTLAVLILAVVVLSGVTRHSLSRIVLATSAQDELQLKWGVVSCRQALLPHAKQILDAADGEGTGASPSIRGQVRLGKHQYTLVVADEAAKANVNAILRGGHHRWEVEQAIRDALRGSGVGNHLRLAVPLRGNPSPIGSFAQILPDVAPTRLLEQQRGPLAPADMLTCWSDGKISLLRATEPALEAVLTPKLTPAQLSDLFRARTQLFGEQRASSARVTAGATSKPSEDGVDLSTPAGRSKALARLVRSVPGLSDGSSVRQLLSDRSTCYSVWVLADDGEVRTSEFTAMETADPRHPKYWSLAW
jgi:hypothetical protein